MKKYIYAFSLIFIISLPQISAKNYFGLKYAENILDTDRLDPAKLSRLNQIRTGELIYSRLWRYNDRLLLEPDLLKELPVAATHNGQEALKCELKEKLKWPDGVPITVADIQYTLSYYKKNGKGKKKKIAQNVELVKKGESSFLLVGKEKNWRYEAKILFPIIQILPKHILKGVITLSLETPYVKKPMGSGPFQMESKPMIEGNNVEIKFKRNDYSIDNPIDKELSIQDVIAVTEPSRNNRIKVMTMSDDESVGRLNEHKGYDLLFQNIRDKETLNALYREKNHLDARQYISNTVLTLTFNTQKPYVNSVAFRKTLDMIIDDPSSIIKFYHEKLTVVDFTGPFSPHLGVIDNTIKDRVGTKDEIVSDLKDQGFIVEEGKPLRWINPASGEEQKVSLKLLYNSNFAGPGTPEKLFLDAMVKNMKEYGIEIIPNPNNRINFKKSLKEKEKASWDLAIVQYNFGLSGDVSHILNSKRSSNYSSYSSLTLDKYLKQYKSGNSQARNEAIKKIHQHCFENLPYLFLWSVQPQVFYRKIIKDITITPQYFFTTIGKWGIESR